jgi:hypothetical protein
VAPARSDTPRTVKSAMLETASSHTEIYVGGAGKIRCPRCTARSKRSGLQCGRPANKTSKTQKCQFHGGRSTGPRTSEGMSRVIAAHLRHGQETLHAKANRSKQSALLLQLEDATYVLRMVKGARTRGRKPGGYAPVTSVEGVLELVMTVEGAEG